MADSARSSRTRAAAGASFPTRQFYVDGAAEAISKGGTFVGRHICVPLEGAAVHINAFNFPVWGMLEKLSTALLAGVPSIVKPATVTSYLTEAVARAMVESGILPPGAFQLLCGSAGDLLDHVGEQDAVAFTGSAATGQMLKTEPRDGRALRALQSGSRFAQLLDARRPMPRPGPRSSICSLRKSCAR